MLDLISDYSTKAHGKLDKKETLPGIFEGFSQTRKLVFFSDFLLKDALCQRMAEIQQLSF